MQRREKERYSFRETEEVETNHKERKISVWATLFREPEIA